MKRQDPSIFNDIVGPYMIGPSSSHTCGPSRIGYLTRQLVDGRLKKVIIDFAKDGAYTNMYQGQKSDLGFINGLLGNMPDDPKLKDSIKIAKEQNLNVEFKISDYEPIVPNISKISLFSEKEEITAFADSTGSGTIKILEVDGFETSIIGDCFELLIKCHKNNSEKIEQYLKEMYIENEGLYKSFKENLCLINLKTREDFNKEFINSLNQRFNDIFWIKTIKPVISILSNRNVKVPFKTAEELLKLSNEKSKDIWELAIEYEMVRGGLSKQEVITMMENVIETMEKAVKSAIEDDIYIDGIIKPTAKHIKTFVNKDKRLDMGVIEQAVVWSIATMEYSNAMGVVLCAPTGGSAGVFPGAILGVGNALNWTMEEKVKAMLVTSIIGIVMSKDYTFSAELYGCQVEPGAASGMAAGGLVSYMGGSSKQILQAASTAVQNILGTICDPVAGLVQIPCINRNAMSVGNAVISANMVLGGFDPLIPLDEVSDTLFKVGMQLPSELRCTCHGGLCTTPKGQELAKLQDERNKLLR